MVIIICVFTEKTQSRQHGEQEEDNRYGLHVCVLVNVHHLSVILCLFVWVLFSFHG